MEGFDRRSALAQSLMMGGLGILAANQPRPARAGPVGLGSLLGQGGMMGMQHFYGLKNEAEAKAAAAAKEAAAMNALQGYDIGPDGSIVGITKRGDVRNLGATTPRPDSFETWKIDPENPSQMISSRGNRKLTPSAEANSRLRAASAGRSVLNFNNITVPQGYVPADPNDPSKGYVVAPGGPVEAELKEKAKAARARLEKANASFGVVEQNIKKAKSMAGFWSTGLMGQALKDIGGTPARDLRGVIDTVVANIGFDQLQGLRDISPTGGALGQVTERELALLQSTLGNLEQSQSQQQFLQNLDTVLNQYKNSMANIKAAYEQTFGPGSAGGDEDDIDRKIRELEQRLGQ